MTDETVENKLRAKLESGEIDQEEYDTLIAKFSDLDLLSSTVETSKKRNYSYSGSRTIDGGEIPQPIRVSGKMTALNSVSCPSFQVSGSAIINGDLSVAGPTKVSGSLKITENGKFGGPFKLSGKTIIGVSAYFMDEAKISGNLQAGEKMNTDSNLKISGKLTAVEVQSTAALTVSGKIETTGDVNVNTFVSSGGASQIGGSLIGEKIEIAKIFREGAEHAEFEAQMDDDNIQSLGDLGYFISNMVTKFIPKLVNEVVSGAMSGKQSPPKIFRIEQDLRGKNVDISYTHINGDLEGDDMVIGPEVTVGGEIRYRNSISVPEGSNYEIKRIN